MPVLRLTSKKTLPLLLEALQRVRFTQTELAEALGISVGRVNRVITWLKDKEVIVKEQGRYVITQPNRLTDLIASQQILTKTRTFQVTLPSAQELKKQKLHRCLGSALACYDKDTQAPVLELIDNEATQQYFNSLPRGEQQVNLYAYDLVTVDEQKQATSIIRTIIDLKSEGRGKLVDELASRLWGTRQ